MLVGEIGISRHEFLYELQFWEARRIIRGYRRRDILKYQLLRLAAYGSMFSMRDPKGKGPEDWLPLSFDKENDRPPLSEDEQNEILELIENVNKSMEAEAAENELTRNNSPTDT